MSLLILIFVIWMIIKVQNKNGRGSIVRRTIRQTSSKTRTEQIFKKKQTSVSTKKQASATPNKTKQTGAVWNQQASAVPNSTKGRNRTKEEAAMEQRTRASAKKCQYEAAYSKGMPKKIGSRGDYEASTPQGMSRIRCAYCGAENLVPSRTHEHYHCYFCWEKL